MVEISPGSCPSSFAFKTRRMILPDRVLVQGKGSDTFMARLGDVDEQFFYRALCLNRLRAS